MILKPDEERVLRPLEYLLRIAVDGDPMRPGFQAQPMYIFLNLAVPIVLGSLLGGLMKIVARMRRTKKKRREK